MKRATQISKTTGITNNKFNKIPTKGKYWNIVKTIRLIFGLFLLGIMLTSCVIENDHYHEDQISLEEALTQYDIWYVDFNNTTGYGDVPFLSKAFTISFINGKMYANNNIAGLGFTGDGYGIQTGFYNTNSGYLDIDHDLDGDYSFEVIFDSPSHIRLFNAYQDVTYYLDGYHQATFDYDQIFYDNIEYFLQEYEAWVKTFTSIEGELNEFDNENFLAFTPENITTFYSSLDNYETPIDDIFWDYEGEYEIFDVNGYENLKILSLTYDIGGNEEFELSVTNDSTIELYHNASGTTYEFSGEGYIQYKNTDTKTRKKIKVKRKSKERTPRNKTKKFEHSKNAKSPSRK